MGAFFIASMSMFTSCKDYDDDINDLQAQIDKAALKTDLDNLSSTLTSVKTTADNALAQATANKADVQAAKDAATQAAAQVAEAVKQASDASTAATTAKTVAEEAKKAADAAAADASEALKQAAANSALAGELQKAVKTMQDEYAKYAETNDAQLKELADNVKKFQAAVSGIWSAVSHIELFGTLDATGKFEFAKADEGNYITFETGAISNDRTFGNEKITANNKTIQNNAAPKAQYTKDATISFPAQVVVRVDPANAQVTKDMVKIVNSKGEELKVLAVDSVWAFDQVAVRTRAASEGGLFVVSLKVAPNTTDAALKKAVTKDNGRVAFFVAINNTSVNDEAQGTDTKDRYAITTRDFEVNDPSAYQGATSLAAVKIYSENTMTKANATTLDQIKDRESRKNYADIPATSGENIIIDFSGLQNVDKFYVVRDDWFVRESDASEINAWNSYSYKGLSQVIDVNNGTGKGQISVTLPNVKGDEIGFRIFAVNYDGKLVAESGNAFYVYVGEDANAASVKGSFVATKAAANSQTTGYLPISGSLKDGEGALPSTVKFKVNGKEITATVEYAKDDKGTQAGKNSEIKYAQFTIQDEIKNWEDGATANFQLVSKDDKGNQENVINVELTKTMPTAETTKALMNYSWKAEQLVNGVYTAYLYPENDAWTTATAANGYKDLNQAINGLKDGFYIQIANADSKKVSNKNVYAKNLVASAEPWKINVSNDADDNGTKLIDNVTKHETTIGYNYGEISSDPDKNDYIVNVETVNTIFACPLNTTAQTYAFGKREYTVGNKTLTEDVNYIVYNTTSAIGVDTKEKVNLLDYIMGTNKFDNSVFGGKLSTLLTSKYVSATAKLTSNANGNEDYFKVAIANGAITFTPQSGTTNPVADVPSTLTITLTDAFGHANVYKLPFTVKRAE
jgi:hypothetical protein